MSIFHEYPESEVSVNLLVSDQLQIEKAFLGLAARPLPRTGILAPNSPAGYIAVKLVDGTWGLAKFFQDRSRILPHHVLGRMPVFTSRVQARSEALRLSLAAAPPPGKSEFDSFWAEMGQVFNLNKSVLLVYFNKAVSLSLQEILFRLDLVPADLPNLKKDFAEGGSLQADLYQRLQDFYNRNLDI